MNNIIKFSIPDYWYFFDLNKNFIEYKQKYSEAFRDNCEIDSIFGSFPSCCWNGGRIIAGNTDYENIYETIKFFNINNISVRHTFSNLLLNENHNYDTLGNTILQISSELSSKYNIINGSTTGSRTLFEYIANTYPEIQLIYSTTLEVRDIEVINKMSENNIVVVSYYFNNKFDLIKQFEHPENIEFICSEDGCIDNCPDRNNHYYFISLKNSYQLSNNTEKNFNCPNKKINYYYKNTASRKSYISYNNIIENYLPLGFNKFKISGRAINKENPINTIENYINYFVKTEYRDIVRNELLLDFYTSKI